MAIKATGQVTIIDVTDAYSVILTSEAYTFVGNTSGAPAGLKCATQAVAYCGSNQCSVVNVDQKAITCPTGISVAEQRNGITNNYIYNNSNRNDSMRSSNSSCCRWYNSQQEIFFRGSKDWTDRTDGSNGCWS